MNIQPAGGSPTPSPTPGGVSDGYTSGGADISDARYSTIQSFSFSSDVNAVMWAIFHKHRLAMLASLAPRLAMPVAVARRRFQTS